MDMQQIRQDVYFLLGIFILVYIGIGFLKKRHRMEMVKSKRSFHFKEESIKRDFGSIQRTLGLKQDTSKGKFLLETVMEEMGIAAERLSMRTTKKILQYLLKKDGKDVKILNKRCARPVIRYMYLNFQLCLETGPFYRKTQSKLRRKMRGVSRKEIEQNLAKQGVDFDKATISAMKKSFSDFDFQNDLQNSIQNQMMQNMQDQMVTDMQNQMMFDMQNQMMMDMQNQMMMDMQNQMMTDMQNQMMSQMQTQMQADMMQSMHDSQMAITSYDHGGHMNNFDSMHNDFNNHLGM